MPIFLHGTSADTSICSMLLTVFCVYLGFL